ncbi:MAG: s-methyl-5-thioribose-1-phosphate isomerase [Prochlorotrichaceae cyanobacterium]
MLDTPHIYPLVWNTDHLLLLDQNRIPRELSLIEVRRGEDLGEAIQRQIIRGNPVIRVAMAYALYLGAQKLTTTDRATFLEGLGIWVDRLEASAQKVPGLDQPLRPLYLALQNQPGSVAELKNYVLQTAQDWHLQELQTCYAIGEQGLEALPSSPDALGVLVYGNCGGLATTGYGTALGVVRSARRIKRIRQVYVAETRPSFQGARFAAWECVQEGIPVAVMTEGMVGVAMQQGLIDVVILGAQGIAANGDVVNWVGSYLIALAAEAHRIPVMVTAPWQTVDFDKATGQAFTVTNLSTPDSYEWDGTLIYPPGAEIYSPAYDVVPENLIQTIVTERGNFKPGDLKSGRSWHK